VDRQCQQTLARRRLGSVMSRWRANAHEHFASQRVLRRAVLRMRASTLSGALARWALASACGRRQRTAMARIVARLRSAAVAKVFLEWLGVLNVSVQDRYEVKHSAAVLELQQQVQKQQAELHVMRSQFANSLANSFACHSRRNLICMCILEWQLMVDQRATWKLADAQAGLLLRRVRLRQIVIAWRMSAKRRLATQHALKQAVFRMQKATFSKAWMQWATLAEYVKQQRTAMGRVISRLQNATITGAFGSWMEAVEAAARRRHQQASAAALEEWRARVSACEDSSDQMRSQLLEKLASNCLRHMRHRLASCVLLSWQAMVDERETWRLAAVQAIERLRVLRLSHVLGRWFSWAESKAAWRIVDRQCQQTLARRRLGSVMSRWRANAHEHFASQRVLRRAVLRMQASTLSGALARWALASACGRRQRTAMARIVARLRSAVVAQAFISWVSMVDQARVNRQQAAHTGSVVQLVAQLSDKDAVMRLLRQQLLQKIAACCVRLWNHRCLSESWRGWHTWVNSRETWRLATQQAVLQLRQSKQAWCFARWLSWAETRMAWHVMQTQCTSTITRHWLSRCLAAWQRGALWRRTVQTTLGRGIGRTQQSVARRVFGSWVASARHTSTHRERREHARSLHEATLQLEIAQHGLRERNGGGMGGAQLSPHIVLGVDHEAAWAEALRLEELELLEDEHLAAVRAAEARHTAQLVGSFRRHTQHRQLQRRLGQWRAHTNSRET
jgi:hypothetical protein